MHALSTLLVLTENTINRYKTNKEKLFVGHKDVITGNQIL